VLTLYPGSELNLLVTSDESLQLHLHHAVIEKSKLSTKRRVRKAAFEGFMTCASPKLRPNEKSCDPPAQAAGQNYLTIGRALERLGVFEPRAELWRKPAGKSNPFAGVLVLYY
jgi:hypothetical protein